MLDFFLNFELYSLAIEHTLFSLQYNQNLLHVYISAIPSGVLENIIWIFLWFHLCQWPFLLPPGALYGYRVSFGSQLPCS